MVALSSSSRLMTTPSHSLRNPSLSELMVLPKPLLSMWGSPLSFHSPFVCFLLNCASVSFCCLQTKKPDVFPLLFWLKQFKRVYWASTMCQAPPLDIGDYIVKKKKGFVVHITCVTVIQLCHNSGVKELCLCACLVARSCPTLWDPVDCSPPGSSVHGILQTRILEWVTIPVSRGSSWLRNQTWVPCTAGRSFTILATRETPRGIDRM